MFSINIDLSQLNDLMDLKPLLKSVAQEAGDELSKMIVAKAKEKAADKLHTRRQMYQDALSSQQESDGVWVIHLDKKVRWIDDGQTAFDMLKGLLNSPKAKYGKNGKYIIIPFDHSPGGRGGGASKIGRTEAGQDLVNAIKNEFKKDKWKKQGVTFGGIEKDANGNDRYGRLHSFSIDGPPKRDAGLGQRRGPVGEPMQGAKEKGQTSGTPFLHGVSVYQTKDSKGRTQRSVLTFRVASENKGGATRWEHPGNAAVDILGQAVEEAIEMWGKDVVPKVLDKNIK